MTKVEQQVQRAIGGKVGSIIRTPTRALAAEDELFKAMARRMELAGLAMREARKAGLKGGAARTRAAELIENPSDDMLARSFDYGRYLTFQRPLGDVGRKVSQITEAAPILKLVVPFVRTPLNLLKFAIERSPGAPLLKEWRKDIAAGGARRDLALAKVLVGTGVGATIFEMAQAGQITGGGPADPAAKRLLQANGWQPYSLKVGDRYYSYSRLDPYSTTIGTAADLVDLQSHMTDKQREHGAMLVGASILNNLGNKTWLSGLASATEAINDPDRYLNSFISRTVAGIATPTISGQIAATNDPYLREARGPLDRIRSRIPGLSSELPARRDIFGRALPARGGVGPDIVSPVYISTDRNDPTTRALLSSGVSIGVPTRKIGERELTPAEYSEYSRVIGEGAKPALDRLVRDPSWRQLDSEGKQDAVDKLMKRARADARATLFGGGKRKANGSEPVSSNPALPPGLTLIEGPRRRPRRKLPDLPPELTLTR